MPTYDEQRAKAIQRAKIEGLRTWRLDDGNYLVRSRYANQGAWYIVRVAQGDVTYCPCPGFERRAICIHAGAVLRRLARKEPPVVTVRWREATKEAPDPKLLRRLTIAEVQQAQEELFEVAYSGK